MQFMSDVKHSGDSKSGYNNLRRGRRIPKRVQQRILCRRRALRSFGHVMAFIFGTIGALLVFVLLVMLVLTHGPSTEAKKLFVLSTNETSAIYFLPSWYLPKSEIDSILNPQTPSNSFKEYPIDVVVSVNSDNPDSSNEGESIINSEPTLVDVSGPTFKGKLLIVPDPSQIRIVALEHFGGNGVVLSQMIENHNGIAGTNAGGFVDEDGRGNGGTPDGLVIMGGRITYGSAEIRYRDVVGFDSEHRLHVGDLTGQEALNEGIVEGISFSQGPVLIKDGVRLPIMKSGINPRTCIGQCADGTVLMVAIEGRFPDSLGATTDDLANLMEEYGAVNAANLDGGSSSGLYYYGERVTRSSSVVGDRPLCTAIVVLDKDI